MEFSRRLQVLFGHIHVAFPPEKQIINNNSVAKMQTYRAVT